MQLNTSYYIKLAILYVLTENKHKRHDGLDSDITPTNESYIKKLESVKKFWPFNK